MAGKNKKPTKYDTSTQSKVMQYIFAFIAIILILSMVFSAFVTY